MDFSLYIRCFVICLTFVFSLPSVSQAKSHRQECTKKEIWKAACLNTGVCYAIELSGDGQRSVFCHCNDLEKGRRCEQKVFRAGPSIFRTVAIVLLCCLAVVGAICLICFLRRSKKCSCTKLRKDNKNSQANEEKSLQQKYLI